MESETIDVRWGDADETYLLWHFHGDWTGESYFNSLLQLWEMMDTKEQRLNLVLDLRTSGKNPSNLTSLIQAAIRKGDCNINRVIVISESRFWESIYEITCRTSPLLAALDVTFVKSTDDAQTLLSQFGT
jgi:hypothetical protein